MNEAGWHPDPSGRFSLRWWDGTTWTAHAVDHSGIQVVEHQPQHQPFQPHHPFGATTAQGNAKPWAIGMIVASAVLVACAFMPWAELGIFSKSGTEGDGAITLVAALVSGGVAIGAAVNRGLVIAASIVAMLVGVGCAFVGVIDIMDVDSKGLDVGVGLIGTAVAGVGLTVAGIGGLIAQRDS
jgi:hypothetical protein